MALTARGAQVLGLARRLSAWEPLGRSGWSPTLSSASGPGQPPAEQPQTWGSASHTFASLSVQKAEGSQQRLQQGITIGRILISQIAAQHCDCALTQLGDEVTHTEVWKELLRQSDPSGGEPDGIAPLRADSVKRKRKRKMNKHKQRKRRKRDRKLKK